MGYTTEEIRILDITKLDEPPAGRETDRAWWRADLESEESRHTILLWAADAAAQRVEEGWLRGEIERLADRYRTLSALGVMSPFHLVPPIR